MTTRSGIAQEPPDVTFFEAANPEAIGAYLLSLGVATLADLPVRVARAGDGNMNLTLRVALSRRSVIMKQGRPWVEKYRHIPAPGERTLVEGAFYRAVAGYPDVAGRMPALLRLDAEHRVIVLEDLGTTGDYTSLYADGLIDVRDLESLLEWLSALSRVAGPHGRLANRAMRRLNHEHIFSLPLAAGNGLDLDAITPGLGAAAQALHLDAAYRSRVAALGEIYLADAPTLVHGDYFPGSWVRTAAGIRIIDPEFCFAGAREFDYGVMLAHLAIAAADRASTSRVLAAGRDEGLDEGLLLGFAGVEIMRRLLGVAQLPLSMDLERKRTLLALSRALVLSPAEAVPWA